MLKKSQKTSIRSHERGPSPGRTTRRRLLSGADITCEALIENGVDVMFGIPGGVVLPFYDSLTKYPKIHHVLVRHEQAGGFAADGYARVKNRPGVALGTSGPGATNLLTAITNAAMDSVPVVFLTGQVHSALIGSDAFQETDILGMTYTIVKHSYAVTEPEDISHAMNEAFAVAMHGRPGPVLVDITKDAFQKEAYYTPGEKITLAPMPTVAVRDAEEKIRELEKLLSSPDTKPLVIVGHGVSLSKAHEEVHTFVQRHNLPVANTLLGVGTLTLTHPLSLSMLGMHGEVVANYAAHEANLIIGIGIRFDDRITGKLDVFKEGKRFVHIEIDASEVSKNVPTLIAFHGDVRQTLALLNKKLTTPHRFNEWWKSLDVLKKKYPLRGRAETKWISRKGLSTPVVVEKISQASRGEAIVATDVGRHQMWVPRFYDFKNHDSFLSSGGLGAMGYGMPAAMGAKCAAPDREVWAICGDGSFQMNIQELATLLQENIDIKIAIINDSSLGIVRQWQQSFYKGNISQTDFMPIDFAAIARAYGHPAQKVKTMAQLESAIAEARAHKGTYLIDVTIDHDEHVYPIVPPMTALGEQIIG